MSLIDLPYELRQTILQHALRQNGTIELQSPVWAGLGAFANPLFHVSRSLREEAIEAFYRSNIFLWITDVEVGGRSDPATYSNSSNSHNKSQQSDESTNPLLLPSTLPWLHPKLMEHLRHLQVNVHLPQSADAMILQHSLEAFVKSLDHGRRLSHIHILITAKRRAQYLPLTTGEVQALEVLAQMRVRGSVEVQTRWYFRAVAAGVHGMNLKERMKA